MFATLRYLTRSEILYIERACMASPPGNGACGVGWKERERKSFVAVFRVMRYTESVLLVVLLSLSFIITLWLLGGRPRRDPPRDCLIYSFIPDPTSFETYTLCYFASTFCMGRGTGKAHNKTKEKRPTKSMQTGFGRIACHKIPCLPHLPA